jgi:hypothetical protein
MRNISLRNRCFSILVSIALVLSLFAGLGITASAYSGGSGTATDPYQIATVADLQQLETTVNGGNSYAGTYFELTASIDLTGTTWTPIGLVTIGSAPTNSPIVTSGDGFAGYLDGQDYTISGLSVRAAQSGAGLFGYLAPSGTLQNLTVTGTVGASAGYDAVGGVVGYNSGTVINVTGNVDVTASSAYNVGGIAGFNDGQYSESAVGIILNSANTGDIDGNSKIGGITGENSGQIISCYNTGTITSSATQGNIGVGGIAGRNGNNNTAVEAGYIANSYNAGTIGDAAYSWLGGITGFQNVLSSTYNCYDTGVIFKGYNYYNPIVGRQESTAKNCYSLEGLNASGNTPDEIGTVMSSADMQAPAFVTTLNGNAYVSSGIWAATNGYPGLVQTALPADYTTALVSNPVLNYTAGQTFDTTGMVITATPSGGGTAININTYGITNVQPLTTSDTTDTVYSVVGNTPVIYVFNITISSNPGVIDSGGTYYLTNTTQFPDGKLQINTSDSVILIGGGTSATSTSRDLNIIYTVSGADLTLQDVFISTATDSVINFTGAGNTITLVNDNILEGNANNAAVVHVPPSADLTITGAGTLYFYKNALAAGIGGNYQEVNGAITIDSTNLFLKGTRTGAGIGTGADSRTAPTPGNITINNSQVNLVTVSRGAALGGGVNGGIGTINITDSSVNIVCDFNGAAIGVGDSATVTGTVNLTNSSLAASATQNRTSTTPLVTANVYQAGQTVNMYEADVDNIPNGAFAIDVDSAAYVSGTMAAYSYTANTSYTPGNWTPDATGTVGVWLPNGADYLITANGTYYKATWNSTNNTFSVGAAPSVTVGGGGASTWIQALARLGTVGILEVAGSASINGNLNITSKYIVTRASGYNGSLITVDNGDALTVTGGVIDGGASSAATGSLINVVGSTGSVTINGGTLSNNTTTGNGGAINISAGSVTITGGTISGNTAALGNAVYIASGSGTFTLTPGSGTFAIDGTIYEGDNTSLYIGASLANISGVLTLQVPTPTGTTIVARASSGYTLTTNDAASCAYVNSSAWNVVWYSNAQLRLQAVSAE